MTTIQRPSELERQLNDYRLTTAEILYRLPDHPKLLQTYVWQDLDLAPKFPVLRRFLDWWDSNLEGRLFQVRVGAVTVLTDNKWRHALAEYAVH